MVRDPRVEAELANNGVLFEYVPAIPLAQFDKQRSLENRGRIGAPLDPERVTRLALAYLDGAAIPAVVCYEGPAGYILNTGNHRYGGAEEAGLSAIDAYVLLTKDEYVLERTTRTLNGLEGVGASTAELIEHGKYLVLQHNRPVKEIASLCRVKPEALAKALRVDETKDRLAGSDIAVERLSDAVLERLSSLRSNRVLSVVASLVTKGGVTGVQIDRLVPELNKIRDESQQVRAAVEYGQRPEVVNRVAETRNGRAATINSPRNQLWSSLARLSSVFNKWPTLAQLHVTAPEDKRRFETALRQLRNQLSAVERSSRNE